MTFIPLLTLSADLLAKFESASQEYGLIRTFHLDELYEDNQNAYDLFLQLCYSTHRSSTDTNFVFLSPHFLINHPAALAALLHAARQRTLRVVVMDEAHLHVQHAESFREDCRILIVVFFRPVFHPDNGTSIVCLLVLTATLPKTYVPSLVRLTTVQFPPRAIIRSTSEEFSQRDIVMKQSPCVKGDYVKRGLEIAINFLRDKQGKMIIFTNFRNCSFDYLRHLE